MGLIRSPNSDPVLAQFAANVGPDGPVTIRGGGTHWDVGGLPDPSAREIRPPQGIVEIRADEMTVEVRAGTLVTELHEALKPFGQRTSLPELAGSSVGGVISLGWSGIARLGRGQVRDSVLQVHYVSADGDLITAGGPTVKNVSGFDLCRVLVGSLGTLGCLGDMILRTRPIPEVEEWNRIDDIDPFDALKECATAASILWDGHSTWVLSAGYRVDVDVDFSALAGLGRLEPDEPPELPVNRWSRCPAELAEMKLGDPIAGRFVAEVGVGMVHSENFVGGPARPKGVVALERRVKEALDPAGRFNPGRTLGRP